jgi:hypothetical protein
VWRELRVWRYSGRSEVGMWISQEEACRWLI